MKTRLPLSTTSSRLRDSITAESVDTTDAPAHDIQQRNLHELWLIRPFAVSPPRRFAHWLVRPRTWYHFDTTTETLCLEPSFHSFPRSVQGLMCDNQLKARRRCVIRRIAQGAWTNQPGANKPGSERARGRKSQGANRLGGETAKGRKSHIPPSSLIHSMVIMRPSNRPHYRSCPSVCMSVRPVQDPNSTRAQLSLGLADRTHGAHSQPASITVRV